MRSFTRSPLERMGVAKRSVSSTGRRRVELHRNVKTTPHTRGACRRPDSDAALGGRRRRGGLSGARPLEQESAPAIHKPMAQGRALHSDAAARVGLRCPVHPLVAPHAGLEGMAAALQHRPAADGPRIPAFLLTLSTGSAVNNLARKHRSSRPRVFTLKRSARGRSCAAGSRFRNQDAAILGASSPPSQRSEAADSGENVRRGRPSRGPRQRHGARPPRHRLQK